MAASFDELTSPVTSGAEFSVVGQAPLAGQDSVIGRYPTLTIVAMNVHQSFTLVNQPPYLSGTAWLGLAGRQWAYGCSHQAEAYLFSYPDAGGGMSPFLGCSLASRPELTTTFTDTVAVSGWVKYGYTFDSGCPYPDYWCSAYTGTSGVSLTRIPADGLAISGDSVRDGVLRAWPTREYVLKARPSPATMGQYETPVVPVASAWTFTPDSGAAPNSVCSNGSQATCLVTFDRSGVLRLEAMVNGQRMTSTPLRVELPGVTLDVSRDSAAVADTVIVTTTLTGADPSKLASYIVTPTGPPSTGGTQAAGIPSCLGTWPVPLRCFVVMTQAGVTRIEAFVVLERRLNLRAHRDVRVTSSQTQVVIDSAGGVSSVHMRPSEIVGIRKDSVFRRAWLRVRVIDATGKPIPKAEVRLSLRADQYSGGHEHGGADRPRGIFPLSKADTLRVSTGTTGEVLVQYQSPDPSGLVTVTGTSSGAKRGVRDIVVAVDGLVRQDEIAGRLLHVGKPGTHHDRFWLTPKLQGMLVRLADTLTKRFAKVPLQKGGVRELGINDASLILGGMFDISGHWAPPHRDHRNGQGADLRTTDKTKAQSDFMRFFWERKLKGHVYDETANGTNPEATGPHYHFMECKSQCNR